MSDSAQNDAPVLPVDASAQSQLAETSADTSATQIVFSTGKLYNQKVFIYAPSKKDPDHIKKFGRVHYFLFHPSKPRCVGFLVKRPDMALMFHRKDSFVAHDGFAVVDGRVIISDSPKALGAGALKRLGIKLDECVIWSGLPVMTQSGATLGYVGDVHYERKSGKVVELEISQGATTNALLGKRIVSADEILGFKRGIGVPLHLDGEDNSEGADDERMLGALLVADQVAQTQTAGGVAEKAGEATAVISDKAQKTYKKVVKEAKPKVEEASKIAGEAINKGVYATGKQVGRASGMFGKFADEFKKGMRGE